MSLISAINNVRLVDPETGRPGHFVLREFENALHLAAVHPTTLWSLERTREDLNNELGGVDEVIIVVTGGLRLEADQEALAERLGWIDEGGVVSRTSKHLLSEGACAVDFTAKFRSRRMKISQAKVGEVARRHFDFVKDNYPDLHVHADNRDGCRAWENSSRHRVYRVVSNRSFEW